MILCYSDNAYIKRKPKQTFSQKQIYLKWKTEEYLFEPKAQMFPKLTRNIYLWYNNSSSIILNKKSSTFGALNVFGQTWTPVVLTRDTGPSLLTRPLTETCRDLGYDMCVYREIYSFCHQCDLWLKKKQKQKKTKNEQRHLR